MRKFALVALSSMFALVTVGLSAQQTSATLAKKTIHDQVLFDTAVKVGNTTLNAGNYSIVETGNQVTFRHIVEDMEPGNWKTTNEKPIVVTCTLKENADKHPTTEVDTPVDGSGTHVLKQILIGDSQIELDFN